MHKCLLVGVHRSVEYYVWFCLEPLHCVSSSSMNLLKEGLYKYLSNIEKDSTARLFQFGALKPFQIIWNSLLGQLNNFGEKHSFEHLQ